VTVGEYVGAQATSVDQLAEHALGGLDEGQVLAAAVASFGVNVPALAA
jgi:hypothetical protein